MIQGAPPEEFGRRKPTRELRFGEQLPLSFLDSEVAAELYVDEIVDGGGRLLDIDRSGSVSALVEVEGAIQSVEQLKDQFRRILKSSDGEL